MFVPLAQRIHADGTVEIVEDPSLLPTGAWGVTLILESGQTWTLPNDLGPWITGSLPGSVPLDAEGQGGIILLQ